MKQEELEVYEASLEPERLKVYLHEEARREKSGTGAYGTLDRSWESLKASMKVPRFDLERVWNLLRGAYDPHVHSGPASTTSRLHDELEMAIHACYVGLGGLCFKVHDTPSTRSAKILQRVVDQWAEEHNKKKIELFGGVVLNYAVGGLNPDAVIAAYRVGGKYVWTPTYDSNHHRAVMGQGVGEGIDFLDENDKLVPKAREVLELVAEGDMTLGVCHQSTKERFIIAREALKMGVKRVEIVHVNFPTGWMTPDQCKLLADMGAYIGIYACMPAVEWTWEDVYAVYKAVGPERIVFSADGGNPRYPYFLDGLRRLIFGFLIMGVPDEHVKIMCQTNTYNLLH